MKACRKYAGWEAIFSGIIAIIAEKSRYFIFGYPVILKIYNDIFAAAVGAACVIVQQLVRSRFLSSL
jgi:hypothetical protein